MSITQYQGKFSDGGFGVAAVLRARADGLSDSEIKEQVDALNLKLGEKAAAVLNTAQQGKPNLIQAASLD